MRVALDATPLLGTRTGVATFTEGLLRALASNAEVEPVAFAMSLRGWRRLAEAVPPGVATIRRPLPAAALNRLWRTNASLTAERLLGPVDVVHGTNYVVPPTDRAGAVVSVYDLTAVRFPDMVEPASLAYPDLVRAAARRGALVHVTAEAIRDEVVDLLGVPSERVRVVAAGVDAPDRQCPGDAARGRRLAGGDRYLLALGTVEPRKGFADLVAAFDAIAGRADLADLRLVIAGPDGWGVDEMIRAIDRARHRRRIRRIGWVDDRDRAALLAGATLFAMPSRYEGFGFPPLEAMAAGTPVVATSAGSLPEIVGDAAYTVAVGDVDALAGALAALVEDDAERARLADLGRARAATFTWERCAAAMVDVYTAACATA